MRDSNHTRPDVATTPDGTTRRPAEARSGPSLQLLSDAVVAGYIHDISARHRPERGLEERGPGDVAEALAA
jgi:hypothetical protein